MKKENIDLSILENSLKVLEESLAPKNLLERDGSIQRFEFTFELSWKTLARVLQSDKPLEDNSVKGVLREAAKQGLIDDIEEWFVFQYARNQTSHTYDQAIADEVFEKAKKFPPYVEYLLKSLKARLKS